jgi:hypothetical protein
VSQVAIGSIAMDSAAMLPHSWLHEGTTYSLAHLLPSDQSCSWTNKSGSTHHFHGRIRYSNHCISDEAKPPLNSDNNYLFDKKTPRVFDLDRYHLSLSLPALIAGLFEKPTTSVSMTAKANYFIFQTANTNKIQNGERYYAFFNPSYKFQDRTDPLRHHIEVYVESA